MLVLPLLLIGLEQKIDVVVAWTLQIELLIKPLALPANWYFAEDVLVVLKLPDAVVDGLKLLVLIEMVQLGLTGVEVDVFEDFLLYDNFFSGLLNQDLFDDNFLDFFDDFLGDIDGHLNDFLDPPVPCLQLALLVLLRNIAPLKASAEHGQLDLALLLCAFFSWFLVDLDRFVLFVDCHAAIFLAATHQRH